MWRSDLPASSLGTEEHSAFNRASKFAFLGRRAGELGDLITDITTFMVEAR